MTIASVQMLLRALRFVTFTLVSSLTTFSLTLIAFCYSLLDDLFSLACFIMFTFP